MTKKPTAAELKRFEDLLRHALAVLNGDVQNLENDAFGNGTVSVDSRTDGGEGYMQELSLELLRRDEEAVREVIEALERVENGEFGRCESCGKWIRKERLKAVPYARNCITCQTEQERA